MQNFTILTKQPLVEKKGFYLICNFHYFQVKNCETLFKYLLDSQKKDKQKDKQINEYMFSLPNKKKKETNKFG